MDEKPKRRWFRFRLSTVLILTAIAAWAMAIRPRVVATTRDYHVGDSNLPWLVRDSFARHPGLRHVVLTQESFNPQLLSPTLALVAFLAWKAARAVVERRRRVKLASVPASGLQ
jgi:hypothetical protein